MHQPTASTSSLSAILPVVDLANSRNGRTPGKAHKGAKSAVRRSYISPSIKSTFEKRKELEKRCEAVKGVEKEMKEEKQAEIDR